MYNDMNTDQQCTRDVMKANSILDCISKSVGSRLREVFIPFVSELIKATSGTVSCRHEKFWWIFGETVSRRLTIYKDHARTGSYNVENSFRELDLINLEKAAAKDVI